MMRGEGAAANQAAADWKRLQEAEDERIANRPPATPENRLSDAEKDYREYAAIAERLRERRNQRIRDALDAGMTHAQIAAATGLTRGRIGQIALSG